MDQKFLKILVSKEKNQSLSIADFKEFVIDTTEYDFNHTLYNKNNRSQKFNLQLFLDNYRDHKFDAFSPDIMSYTIYKNEFVQQFIQNLIERTQIPSKINQFKNEILAFDSTLNEHMITVNDITIKAQTNNQLRLFLEKLEVYIRNNRDVDIKGIHNDWWINFAHSDNTTNVAENLLFTIQNNLSGCFLEIENTEFNQDDPNSKNACKLRGLMNSHIDEITNLNYCSRNTLQNYRADCGAQFVNHDKFIEEYNALSDSDRAQTNEIDFLCKCAEGLANGDNINTIKCAKLASIGKLIPRRATLLDAIVELHYICDYKTLEPKIGSMFSKGIIVFAIILTIYFVYYFLKKYIKK